MTAAHRRPTMKLARPAALRWLLFVVAAALAAICLAVAVAAARESPATAALMLCSAGAMGLFARALYLAKASAVLFDGERLYDDAGVDLCRLDEVEEVQRGLAFFKPTSGFVLMLTEEAAARGSRGWSPGLWWRIGRRIGVGGATPGRGGKAMADAIVTAMAAPASPPGHRTGSGG